MKKRIFITILMILTYMLLGSCNSCTPSSAQANMVSYCQDSTKVKYDTTIIYFLKEDTMNLISSQDKPLLKKEIKSMEVDTVWKIKRDSSYKQLEKTEKIIKGQHQTIDSLLIIKKRK